MSAGPLGRQRSTSSAGSRPHRRDVLRPATPIDARTEDSDLEPCTATGSFLIYTQGSAIVCLHHDTLKVERRFEKHSEKVLFIAVDNASERGAGKFCVSYDAGLTAIVWDLHNGDEVARFISYEPLKVAAWMRNGNIAFGNSQGSVVIFEPATSEHHSARTIFDPITAIAPAADCLTYALGYKNGSIIIASLQPSFTVLHTLTTSRSPSPIVNLAWHASSSKQKSDMLTSQMSDGDLRVWSIAKPATAENPKTIRILKRGDNVEPGVNWSAWSKNGRVIQYQDGECWLWDVRTKHVSFEPIPSIGEVKGLANYAPTATLFTLSKDHIVRQYDLSPPQLVKERQILPMEPPLAPQKSARSQGHHIPGTAPPMPIRPPSRQSESSRGPVSLSTIQRNAEISHIEQARLERSDMTSPLSASSRADSLSTSSNRPGYQGALRSISTRAGSGTTFSTISPSMVGRDSMFSGGTSMYPSTMSLTSSGRRSRGSRLRNELGRSPEEAYVDLFPRTRIRLATMQYQEAEPLDQDNMSADDLRKRMLRIVFGWDDDIEPLIRDELRFHQPGSTSAVLLSKWLGEVDSDMMAAAIASGNISSSDWMVLALSQMGGANSMGKMGQAFVQRLLQQGDFHTSATILLGLGDREDAVEVYVERCFFMEAILLTCLIFPLDWQRQAHLVRRWGEFVVENSQQQLAFRCFTCTGVEPPIPWGSPSPRMMDGGSQAPSSISSMLSPPISPPPQLRPSRQTVKNSSLKVITSFDSQPMQQQQHRYPGLNSTDRTPTLAPGVTPIAESAVSEGHTPGGFPPRSGGTTGRTVTPGGYYRQRLPSIGETPVDVTVPPFPRPSKLPTPDNSGSDIERENVRLSSKSQPVESKTKSEDPPLLLSSATYKPGNTPTNKTPQTTIRTTVLPSPANEAFIEFQEKEKAKGRNSSRDRKPDGLHIRMPSHDQIQTTSFISRDGIGIGPSELKTSNTMSSAYSGGLRTGRSDTSAKSPSVSGASYTSTKSPSISGRSIDEYIHSVDAASYNSRKHRSKKRQESREGRTEHKPRSKNRGQDLSEDRGRDGKRYVRPAKRSPSSPVPMTPEQYQYESTSAIESEAGGVMSPGGESQDSRHPQGQKQPPQKYRSGSKASDYSQRTIRHRSPEGQYDSSQFTSEATSYNASRQGSRQGSKQGSRQGSRQQSPRGMLESGRRGRSQSKNRAGSAQRSPSSPLPYSPQAALSREDDDETDPLRLVEANRQRIRSRQRSSSRNPRERGTSRARDYSTDRRRRQAEGRSARASENDEPRSAVEPRRNSDQLLKQAEILRRKEQAARELEARRESLLRNPDAPVVPHPHEYSRPNTFLRAQTEAGNSPGSYKNSATSDRFPTSASTVNSDHGSTRSAGGSYGLPATPRAMRHPRYDAKDTDHIPAVPSIPGDMQTVPELYYAGGPMRDIPRSMSAPVYDQQALPMPQELPNHPAFHKGLRPDNKRVNAYQPLGSIGQHRRKGSADMGLSGGGGSGGKHGVTAGIAETMLSTHSRAKDNKHNYNNGFDQAEPSPPPLLAELQHLNNNNATPPPPPPPPPGNMDPEASSLSSNSNVGAINIVLDDEAGDEGNVIEVPPTPQFPPPHQTLPPLNTHTNHTRSPPPGAHMSARSPLSARERDHHHTHSVYDSQSVPTSARSPPPQTTRTPPPPGVGGETAHHKRGRSDNFKNGIKGFTGRLRSNSRGRNAKEERDKAQGGQAQGKEASPYESVPPLYF